MLSFFFCICWIKALTVCSYHSGNMKCRIDQVTVVLGEMNVARVNHHDCRLASAQGDRDATLQQTADTNSRRGPWSATYPVDDVHQARITYSVGGVGDDIWRGQKSGLSVTCFPSLYPDFHPGACVSVFCVMIELRARTIAQP